MILLFMDQYVIALKKEPPKIPDAIERAQELAHVPIQELPPIALGYILFQTEKHESCGDYAQAVEKLKTSNKAYKIGRIGRQWFKNPVKAYFRECSECNKKVPLCSVCRASKLVR